MKSDFPDVETSDDQSDRPFGSWLSLINGGE